MRDLFSFPNPVNEKAARVVAGAVLVMVVVTLATSWYWLLIPLACGFWARLLTGPTLSPLARLAQSVIAPRLGARKPVAGPPKRFAQGIGAVMSTAGLVLALVVGDHPAADVILIVLVAAAALESILGYCLGCKIFGQLMRAGLVPEAVCEECADISRRPHPTPG
jgi:HAMP domain-containing protein